MRVIDLIHSNEKTAFSFEILPPLKGTGIEKLYQTIDTLREFDPKYINITTHRSEYVYRDLGNGLFQRNRLRRRPGTVAVAAAIQNKYNITVVPHILCSGFTQEETEYVLLFGFGTSFAIEVLQMFCGRTSDVDDLLMNTLGALIGYWMFLAAERQTSFCLLRRNKTAEAGVAVSRAFHILAYEN